MAAARERAEERLWRDYVAEALRYAPQGKALAKPYREMLERPARDARSGREIADDVIKRAGLEVVGP